MFNCVAVDSAQIHVKKYIIDYVIIYNSYFILIYTKIIKTLLINKFLNLLFLGFNTQWKTKRTTPTLTTTLPP